MAIASTFWFNNFASLERSGQLANFLWTVPSNAQKEDTNYSLAGTNITPGPSVGNAPYPWLAGSGISNPTLIPAAGVIKGLILRIRRESSNPSFGTATITDTDVRLFLRDTTWSYLGDNKSTGASWDSTFAYRSYGGETDTWGYSFTPNIINNSGFGFTLGSNANFNILYDFRNYSKIDNVELTVFWDYPTINPISIGTNETVNSLTKLRATYNISNVKSIPTQQNISQQRLYSQARITQSSISSSDIVNRPTLYASKNLNSISISTSEFVNSPKLLLYIKPNSISSSESFSGNTRLLATNSILTQSRSISSLENLVLQNVKATNNIRPISISSQDVFGTLNIRTVAKILPLSVSTSEALSTNTLKGNNTIRPSGITNSETVNNLTRLKPSSSLYPQTIGSSENVSRHNLTPSNQIRPITISSLQNVPIVKLTTTAQVKPNTFNSLENVNNLTKFTNKFYDTLDQFNVWTYGDTSSFTWDTTYSINGGGYAIRRTGTSGFRAVAYPLIYDKGPMLFDSSYDFYYAGYVYLTTSDDSAGLGFGLGNNNDVANGYFALINPRNGTGGAANNSFRLIKVTGGVSRTVTTLASYNLSGLIQANQWYRIIITWSTSLITAKLYDKNGTALVSAATLTSSDTTYSSGFYGLSAFNGAVFDVLTNIPAKFIELNNLGISSQQAFSIPSLLPGNVNIRPNGLLSSENFGTLRFTTTVRINHNSISSSESTAVHRLNPGNVNINPIVLTSSEIFGPDTRLIRTIGPSQEILVQNFQAISTKENFGSLLVKSENYNLRPISIITLENIPIPKLKFNINPSGITNLENFGNLKVTAQNNIYPATISTSQNFGTNLKVSSAKNIYPVTISSSEIIPSLRLKAFYNINPVTISSLQNLNIPTVFSTAYIYPRPIVSQQVFGNNLKLSYNSYEIKPLPFNSLEQLGLHILQTKAYIYPVAISSKEIFGNGLYLTVGGLEIRPGSLGSFEQFGLHTLTARKNIYPNTLSSFEQFGMLTVKSVAYIYPVRITSSEIFGNNLQINYGVYEIRPPAIGNQEQFGLHTLKSIAYIYPVTINSQEIFGLLKVNNTLSIYPHSFGSQEQFGIHTLKSVAYIYPVTISSQEIFGNNLRLDYSGNQIKPPGIGSQEQFGLHTLQTLAFIYPVTLNSQEIFGNGLKLDYAGYQIKPLPFVNEEKFGLHELIPGPVYIYPVSINSQEIFGDSLQIFAQPTPPAQNIWPNTSTPNLPGYGSLSQEQIGFHNLHATNEIYPTALNSQEIFSLNNLFNGNIIKFDNQTSLSSSENIYSLKLTTEEYKIRPLPFGIDGFVGNHKLHVNYNIYPKTFDEFERVGGIRASLYLSTLSDEIVNNIIENLPPDYNPLTDFYLTNDNETLFTWDSNEYVDVKININGEEITTGFTLTPTTGLLHLSDPLSTTDVIIVEIYRFTRQNPHYIFPHAFIYPLSIESKEKLGTHWLRPTAYPGRIHSWFEIIHNIESFLDFRNKIA